MYARPGLTLSVEFFPPKTDKGEENLFSGIAAIKRLTLTFGSVVTRRAEACAKNTSDLSECRAFVALI